LLLLSSLVLSLELDGNGTLFSDCSLRFVLASWSADLHYKDHSCFPAMTGGLLLEYYLQMGFEEAHAQHPPAICSRHTWIS
jgi:hypothetical protein